MVGSESETKEEKSEESNTADVNSEAQVEEQETSTLTQEQTPHADEQIATDSQSEQVSVEGEESSPETSDQNPEDAVSEGGEKEALKVQIGEPEYEQFKQVFEKLNSPDEKLQLAIDFMETALSQGGTPLFRYFWEVRKLCLELFKETITPAVRARLWPKYTELSKEARRLKEIFDEQSAFAVEQIDIAIQALEQDIDNFNEECKKSPEVEFPSPCSALGEDLEFFKTAQRELNLYNAHAARVNVMRKELIKTEMRIRHKNKFFQRLSNVGDSIFPKRKELIKAISERFIQAVDRFITSHFSGDKIEGSIFSLREEIKSLQTTAKTLTLNTPSFSSMRKKLSECWDKLKEFDKERKKLKNEKFAVSKENVKSLLTEVQEFNTAFEEGKLTLDQAGKKLSEISKTARDTDLSREDVKLIRDEIGASRKKVREKEQEAEKVREAEEIKRKEKLAQKIEEIRERIKELINTSHTLDAEKIEQARSEITNEVKGLAVPKSQKMELEVLLHPLRDVIAEKQEQALLALSDNDKENLAQLRAVLKQRKERRSEIKKQLEQYRKAAGASGLDFEKAMSYNQQINLEKERLEKIEEGISDIEKQIRELKKKG